MSRHLRQREDLLAAIRRGDALRAVVLAREHLWEFPADLPVRRAIGAYLRDVASSGSAAAVDDELARVLAESAEMGDVEGFAR